MRVALLSIIAVGVAFVLLGVKGLFVKGAKFPSGHVHQSAALRERGITCASAQSEVKTNNHKTPNPKN